MIQSLIIRPNARLFYKTIFKQNWKLKVITKLTLILVFVTNTFSKIHNNILQFGCAPTSSQNCDRRTRTLVITGPFSRTQSDRTTIYTRLITPGHYPVFSNGDAIWCSSFLIEKRDSVSGGNWDLICFANAWATALRGSRKLPPSHGKSSLATFVA